MAKRKTVLSDYPRPAFAVDIVVFSVTGEKENNYRKTPQKKLQVLLIRRGIEPFKGQWALPGGFVREGETAGEAAARELREETGVEGVYIEQLFTFSSPGRDPRDWVVSSAYLALIPENSVLVSAGDDAAEADWFTVSSKAAGEDGRQMTFEGLGARFSASVRLMHEEPEILSNDGLAFDHAKIVCLALERLRGKLDYTDVAMRLLPERFTLSELQQVYEVILGRKLLAPAFRRKIAGRVEKTGEMHEGAGHRPSAYFRSVAPEAKHMQD